MQLLTLSMHPLECRVVANVSCTGCGGRRGAAGRQQHSPDAELDTGGGGAAAGLHLQGRGGAGALREGRTQLKVVLQCHLGVATGI